MTKKTRYFLTKLNAVISLDNEKRNIEKKDIKFIILWQWIYFSIILFSIFFSFVALAIPLRYSKTYAKEISIVQFTTFLILIVDYILLASTSIIRLSHLKKPLLRFFFSFTSFFLLISIASSLYTINLITETNYDVLTYLRTLSIIKMSRLLMLLTFFSSFKVLINVFKTQKIVLTNVFIFIIILIAVLGLIIWNAEANYADEKISQNLWVRDQEHLDELLRVSKISEKEIARLNSLPIYSNIDNIIKNYWDALYFTTISLTTIGYGDVVPYSSQTKAIVILTSLVGIAIFAIPSGVIAGSFLSQVQLNIKQKQQQNLEQKTSNK